MNFYLLIVPFLVACGTELSPKVINDHPEVSILSHVDDAVFAEGETVMVFAQVGDANHSLSDLRLSWLLDDHIICLDQVPEVDGSASCPFNMIAGAERIYVQVVDPDGAAAMDDISISVPVSTPPVVFLMSPVSGTVFTTNDLIPFQGIVSDDNDAPEELSIAWRSNLDGDLPINALPDSSGSFTDVYSLSVGQHFIELLVIDSAGKTTVESALIEVSPPNSPPSCSVLTPSSGEVVAFGDSVSFEAQVADVDQPNVTLDVRWISDKDGEFAVSIPDSNGGVISLHSGLSLNTHAITLSVSDDAGEMCAQTFLLTVGGPPTLVIDSPIQGTVVGQSDWVEFIATVSDIEDPPADIFLNWESSLDGSLLSASQSASGVHQFSRDDLSPGNHLLTATATDSHGQIATAWVDIRINMPPETPSLTLSPNPALSNQDISASVGSLSDPDGDPVTLSYLWQKDGLPTGNVGSVLPMAETAKNQVWTLVVTPNDGYDDGLPVQSSVNILNSPPEINSIGFSSNTATITGSSVLNATIIDFDADGDPINHTYLWAVNGVAVGGNSGMLDGNLHFSRGDTVSLEVTPDDGEEIGAVASASVLVGNAPPTAPTFVEITPNPAIDGDALSCSASGSIDPDQDPITLIYSWIQNGVQWSGATTNNGSLIPTGNAVAGDIWICEVYASDGIDNSLSVQSNPVEIDSYSISIPCDHCITLPNGTVVGLNEIPSGVLFGGNALSNDYLMMTTEVTQDMFVELMGYNNSQYTHPGQPVENVNWHEAAAFANALSAHEGWQECYTCNLTVNNDPSSFQCVNNGNYYGSNIYLCPGYRLPTDAEWEHAARIGVGYHFWTANGGGSLNPSDYNSCDPSIFLTDNSPLSDLAWFCGNASQPQIVGQTDPNGHGIYDFHGNVAEWCQDTYSNWWPVGINPVSTGGVSNVLRGGHWDSEPIGLDVDLRENDYPNTRNANYGFRVIRILP